MFQPSYHQWLYQSATLGARTVVRLKYTRTVLVALSITISTPSLVSRALAEEPDLEQTKAYLVENIPYFLSQWYITHISFDGCNMETRRDHNGASSRLTVHFASVGLAVVIDKDGVRFDGGRVGAISSLYVYPDGKMIPRSDVRDQPFYTQDNEQAKRLARAFNRMRTLCGAKEDPFASPR
jgi:hypothetical protein